MQNGEKRLMVQVVGGWLWDDHLRSYLRFRYKKTCNWEVRFKLAQFEVWVRYKSGDAK